MEDWWEYWFADLDMDGDDSFNQCQMNGFLNIDDEEHQQVNLSCRTETQSHHSLQYYPSCLGFKGQSNVVCWGGPSLEELGHSSSKRTLSFEPISVTQGQGRKRGRSSSEIQDHIMAERKRRQEMAERFITLSAIIPGLKKIDKASVLREAINYVKQLQERIAVLEEESKQKSTTSIISIKKSHSHPLSETNSFGSNNQVLPQVEAIGLEPAEKQLLIRVHCEKRNGILLKILALLEKIHLSVASSSVLPFGKNTLSVTIIAQKGEEYNMTGEELVKSLRLGLLEVYDMHM
ncbi:Myc-type, basic helix-loop-helix [Sesbania bispinosa]|nr:Myc-type, basic helix-loop-helix [Sesbania bispinosa]